MMCKGKVMLPGKKGVVVCQGIKGGWCAREKRGWCARGKKEVVCQGEKRWWCAKGKKGVVCQGKKGGWCAKGKKVVVCQRKKGGGVPGGQKGGGVQGEKRWWCARGEKVVVCKGREGGGVKGKKRWWCARGEKVVVCGLQTKWFAEKEVCRMRSSNKREPFWFKPLLFKLSLFLGVTARDASQGMEHRPRWLGADHPRASPVFGELAQSWPHLSRPSSEVRPSPVVRRSVATSVAISSQCSAKVVEAAKKRVDGIERIGSVGESGHD